MLRKLTIALLIGGALAASASEASAYWRGGRGGGVGWGRHAGFYGGGWNRGGWNRGWGGWGWAGAGLGLGALAYGAGYPYADYGYGYGYPAYTTAYTTGYGGCW